jgi:hypothetical protein
MNKKIFILLLFQEIVFYFYFYLIFYLIINLGQQAVDMMAKIRFNVNSEESEIEKLSDKFLVINA